MSVLSSVILTVCLSAQGSYRDACNSALDAGTKQTGIADNMRQFETNTNSYANNLVDHYVDADIRNITGAGIFLAKAAADRRIDIPLPTLGLADQIVSQFAYSGISLAVRWSF